MNNNPAFSQAVAVSGPARTIYIGAQTAIDPDGHIVAPNDLGAQTEQVLRNLDAVLQAAGATRDNLIAWTIYVTQGHDMRPGFEAGMRYWANRPNPPINTVMYVAGFWSPQIVVAIEALAAVEEG